MIKDIVNIIVSVLLVLRRILSWWFSTFESNRYSVVVLGSKQNYDESYVDDEDDVNEQY